MARMDAPSNVSMNGIGVSCKWSCQRPEMTEQVQSVGFGPVQDSGPAGVWLFRWYAKLFGNSSHVVRTMRCKADLKGVPVSIDGRRGIVTWDGRPEHDFVRKLFRSITICHYTVNLQ